MDASQFDRFTVSLPRRAALGGVFALALGVSSGEGKKKKKPCPPCKKRKKGKCKANLPDGTGCSGGICQSGSCVAVTPPDPCAGRPDDTACNGDGRCLAGICNPKPTCVSRGDTCTVDSVCCSGNCVDSVPACSVGQVGDVCLVNRDCGPERCVGYRCAHSACLADADYCKNGQPTCGSNGTTGSCLRPYAGGPSHCGQPRNQLCNCTSDAQCQSLYNNRGAFCAAITGSSCTAVCPAQSISFCATPA